MNKKIIFTIKIFISIIVLTLSLYCYKLICDINAVPNKYLYLFLELILLINIIIIIGLFIKKIWAKIISIILYLIITILSIVGIVYAKDTLRFLDKSFNNITEDKIKYSIVVLKNSNYKELSDLKSKTIGYLNLDSNKDKMISYINKKVSVKLESYNDNYILYNDLLNKKIEAMLIDDNYLDMLEDQDKEINNKIKILYSFELDIENHEKLSSEEVKELTPINILISGSDSRSNKIQVKSLSDVNMIVTINPKTHTILLTSIPRDYYVQLHGTTGLKDKLTHAGIYGTNMTKRTLEDLFDIDIKYSVKVGMPAVVEIVDLIGGVDIYSDQAFNSSHIRGWHVKKGINHMDGNQALAYARERYAYKNGDNHRIKNQQQVLEAILKKVMKDKKTLLKYGELLDLLSNLYKTDIPKSYISSMVKEQINSMTGWEVLTQVVTGKGASKETYSMPGWKNLYVMIPNEDSVKKATNKINKVLES